MVDGRRDQADRGRRGGQERYEVDRLLEGRDRRKALVERHHEQEREQHLHTGKRDPQLAEHLLQVAIDALVFALVATGLRMFAPPDYGTRDAPLMG